MIGLNVLVAGYFVCSSITDVCCDAPGAGGICCGDCLDCMGGACVNKTDNSAPRSATSGQACCGGVSTNIQSNPFNCGGCSVNCGGATPNCVNFACVA